MASLGLVADYGSENDSSSDEEAPVLQRTTQMMNNKSETAGSNFFNVVEDDSESDENDKIPEKTGPQKDQLSATERLPNPLSDRSASSSLSKLPSPGLLSSNNVKVGSVFANPYQKAEEAKLSILEQHVKMTNPEPQVNEQNKKNICKNFKKGKCRFGHKCKFFHASDITFTPKSESELTDEGADEGQSRQHHGYYGHQSYHDNQQGEEVDDDSYMGQIKRKHRAGIKDGLRPPKKAMIALDRQRNHERPWTN